MRFGLHHRMYNSDIPLFLRRVEAVDRAGFSNVWLGDNALLFPDTFVALALAAERSSRLTFGTGCTHVILRHPILIAAAHAAVDLVAAGRVVCGIGSGDVLVHQLRVRPTSVASLRAAIVQIQRLTRAERVEVDGVDVEMPWVARPIPVWLFAEGPRMLEMGGEVADGVLYGGGVSAEVRAWATERVATGARRVGRIPPPIWHACLVSVGRTTGEARDAIRLRLSNRARHNFLAAPQLVPHERRAEVDRLLAGFDFGLVRAELNSAGDRQADLVTDYMIDRFAVAGTEAEVVRRLRELDREKVDNVMVDLPRPSYDEHIELFREVIYPALSATT